MTVKTLTIQWSESPASYRPYIDQNVAQVVRTDLFQLCNTEDHSSYGQPSPT